MRSAKIGLLGLAVLLAVVAGCRKPTVAELDEKERQDPAVQAAWRAAEAGDSAGAIAQYEAIIRGRPDVARAHLDLAMLLLGAEEKPVKAIYHFMRFQELRPDSEKRDLITRQIRYLTSLIGDKVTKSRVAHLEQELAAARTELAALRALAPAAPAGPAAPASPPAGPVASPAAPAVPAVAPAAPPASAPAAPRQPRIYVVKEGDSLGRIAQSQYGDSAKATVIFEANRGRLKSMDAVMVGQKLVIPP